ncbi:kinase-like protein [Trametes sanguinea]|nr:kinase-like protein [Trametes sanguinea]
MLTTILINTLCRRPSWRTVCPSRLTSSRLRPLPTRIRPFSSAAKAPLIDPSYLVEEETNPWYDPRDFYPVQIGGVLNSRYHVIGKLGYGAYSTVWLCRDLTEHRHVAVKVCVRNYSVTVKRELEAAHHLSNLPETDHPGRCFLRRLLDSFELVPKHAETSHSEDSVAARPFQCLVYEPMAMSAVGCRRFSPGGLLSLSLTRFLTEAILFVVDYLHRHAELVHTDIQERNILIGINDPAAFKAFEDREQTDPTPRKLASDRTIYLSRTVFFKGKPGRPALSDFGEARFGQKVYTGVIQPVQYRAPEVVFGMPWDEKVDIWSIGVMMWDMVEGKNLFRVAENAAAETEPAYDEYLAHIVSLIGPPPLDFLERCDPERTSKYFDAHANWIGAASLPEDSLEKSAKRLEGEMKAKFLDFIRRTVAWKPEDRPSSLELLRHPWVGRIREALP